MNWRLIDLGWALFQVSLILLSGPVGWLSMYFSSLLQRHRRTRPNVQDFPKPLFILLMWASHFSKQVRNPSGMILKKSYMAKNLTFTLNIREWVKNWILMHITTQDVNWNFFLVFVVTNTLFVCFFFPQPYLVLFKKWEDTAITN